jgi:hypothetical protein
MDALPIAFYCPKSVLFFQVDFELAFWAGVLNWRFELVF